MSTKSKKAVARRRDPQLTRLKIIQAAKQLLIDGEGNIEMSWIAKSAGVSQGLAYHHFGSKEGLLVAVVNDFYDRVDENVLLARLDEFDDWETRERTRTQQYIQFLVDDPLASVVMTRLAGSPTVAAVDASRWQRLIDAGSRNMAEGQSRGDISPTADPTLLAALTLGAVRSAVATQMNSETKINPIELTDVIWRFVRGGIGLEEKL